MATTTATGSANLARAIRKLDDLHPDRLTTTQQDALHELRATLGRLERVLAGELRIVVAGSTGSMKSTVLELLLGRPGTLEIGSGAKTAAPTEIRLVRPGDGVLHGAQVRLLTADRAAARARAVLDLPDDDGRTLEQLAEVPHANQWLVRDMLRDSERFAPGQTYGLLEFEQDGGAAVIGGVGVTLIDRLVVDIPAPPDWDLSWAGDRAVVLIDLPGTGEGRVLERVVCQEQRAVAHLTLNIVAISSGNDFVPPQAHAESACVYVATKVDKVENPRDRNELRTLEEAVASSVRRWREDGQHTEIAAVSGTWACADEERWRDLDPRQSADTWRQAQSSRAAWQDAPWDPHGPTSGGLHHAIAAAWEDGGVDRLRAVVADIAGEIDRGRVDRAERDRLIALGRQQVDAATAVSAQGPILGEGDLKDLDERVVRDTTPVDELRRVAREEATAAVYGLVQWDELRPSFTRAGVWHGDLSEIDGSFPDDQLSELAADAVEEARNTLDGALRGWARTYSVDLAATAAPAAPTPSENGSAVPDGFARLGRRLTGTLAAADPAVAGGSRISVRLVAHTREELTQLLEHMLVTTLRGKTLGARAAVRGSLRERERKAATIQPTSGVGNVLKATAKALDLLA
jgi:hypothetical protein